MNHIDFLLDLFVGQEDPAQQCRRRQEETKENSDPFAKKMDFIDICRVHCEHLHSLRASFSKE